MNLKIGDIVWRLYDIDNGKKKRAWLGKITNYYKTGNYQVTRIDDHKFSHEMVHKGDTIATKPNNLELTAQYMFKRKYLDD